MIHNFQSETGTVIPAITTEQMRKVDYLALEKYGPNLFQMMENAGRNLATLTKKNLGRNWRKANIIILAGTGGNGGGGICAGRHLANHGGNVQLVITDKGRVDGVPERQRLIFSATSGRETSMHDVRSADIILDAIIGYSIKGAVSGEAGQLIDWANDSAAPKLSLDVPSGFDSTTGTAAGHFIRATATLTLALPKTGLAPKNTGELYLGDIGIPSAVYEELELSFSSPFEMDHITKITPL
jgi:NAD(P)H-hydrate epimerase